MFKTDEFKALPLYALGIVGLNTLLGIPKDVYILTEYLNGGSNAWLNYQVILAIGCYCLSQTFRPGGRNLGEALFAKPIQLSTTLIFRQILIIVSILWMALVIPSFGEIWYCNGLHDLLGIWRIWPELLYSIATSFTSVLVVASMGMFINFLNGWVLFQVLAFLSSIDIIPTSLPSLEFLDPEFKHPIPLFSISLEDARHWPTYNLLMLMASAGLFAYAYKRWREKQWYLRRA